MKGIQFAITVCVYIGIFYVLLWLFGKYNISFGVVKELYFQMLGYGFCLYFITVLYEQRLKFIGWPTFLSFAPIAYVCAFLYFGENLPKHFASALHGSILFLSVALVIKGPKKAI